MGPEHSSALRLAALRRAIALVSEAIDLLDAHGGCPEGAAHLDLGLQELRREYSRPQADK